MYPDWFKKRLIDLGLSGNQFCEQHGLSRTALVRLLKGNRAVSVRVLEIVATGLKMTTDKVLEEIDDTVKAKPGRKRAANQ